MNSFLFRTAILCLLTLGFGKTSLAQNRCGHDEEHEERLHDPEYRDFLRHVESEVARLKQGGSRITCTNGTFTFPVAIHYNWTGIGTTVDQCMIDAANNSIDALNDDFAATNSDLNDYDALTSICNTYFPASAKSTGSCIQFCIAKYDHPACSELCDGDLAITAGKFNYPNTGGCYSDYINIFVESGTGNLGIAPLSGVTVLGGNGPQVDASTWGGPGVLCTPNGLGSSFNSAGSYNLGRTLTHEMGHYFGLYHVFYGDCGTDDGMADTPTQESNNFGTPVIVNCDPADSGNTANNTCSTLDMFCNYMDYTNDAAMFMFTNDQSNEMYAKAQLSPIADYNVKCNGSPQAPVADFTIEGGAPVFCSDDSAPYMISLMDNSSRCPTSWSWTFLGAGVTPASSTVENPMVTVTGSGDFTVTLTSTNAAGTSTTVSKTVYVSVADPSSCIDCGNVFYDTGGPNSDYTSNENTTWTYCAPSGQIVSMNALEVDLPGGFFEDFVRIFEGTSVPSDLSTNIAILGENNGSGAGFWVNNGSGYSYSGSSLKSTTNCVTFLFKSSSSNEGAGWKVDMACCDSNVTNPECAMKNDPGIGFQATIASQCNMKSIFDLGSSLRDEEEVISSRTCPGISYSNNSYYEITTDDDGGVLEVNVSKNLDNGGSNDIFIIGPLTGDCPDYNYTNSTIPIQQCVSSATATTVSISNAQPNSKYLILVNSELPGSFNISSTAAATALPVEISYFKTELIDEDVLLYWLSSTEVNNDYFTIERSPDGINYTHLANISSQGDTYEGFKYDFLDSRAYYGHNFYRLSQTDKDGNSAYLGVASAKVEFRLQPISLRPNPASIAVAEVAGLNPEENYSVKLISVEGKSEEMIIFADKKGIAKLDVGNLSNGIYFVNFTNETTSQTIKFVKL